MSRRKLVSCLLALTASCPAAADPATESLADIAMALYEHFPSAVYSPFACADTTCSKALNFPLVICGDGGCKDPVKMDWFNARIMVTMGGLPTLLPCCALPDATAPFRSLSTARRSTHARFPLSP